MRNCLSPDIEALLVAHFSQRLDEPLFSAPPVPADIESGNVVVQRVSSFERAYVQDVSVVHFDCYADSAQDAATLAETVGGLVRNIEGETIQAGDVRTYVYESRLTSASRYNPDPRHPTLARYTVTAQIATRMLHNEQ